MKKFSKRLKFREHRALDLDQAIATADPGRPQSRKITSILLEEDVVRELKRLADNREVTYQKLLRVLILEGLKRVERVS